jgi:hypothetical protein
VDRHAFVVENLLEILRAMPSGSLLLIIERTGYQAIDLLLNSLANRSISAGLCETPTINQSSSYYARPIKDSMPSLVMENLFLRQTRIYGVYADEEVGRVLAPNVPYSWSAFRRS